MKTTTFILILFLTGLDLCAQKSPGLRLPPRFVAAANNAAADATNALAPAALPLPPGVPAPVGPSVPGAPLAPAPSAPGPPAAEPSVPTSAPAAPTNNPPAEKEIPAYKYNFQGVEVSQVLDVYADLIGRTILRAGLPQASIILRTQSPLTKSEAIQALQAVLALNNISVVNVGEKFIKALPSDQAPQSGAPIDRSERSRLPELGTYVTHIVQLKYVKPSEMLPILQPFSKLPNSILTIEGNGILVLRDYAENVKRMLEMIDQVDVSVPAEYISEVIPIRYAQAEDIANALNSLGGAGGAMVSFGGTGAAAPISGINTRVGGATTTPGAQPGGGNPSQPRPFGATASGTPTGGSTFSQRLNAIIGRAAGGQPEPIQIFGQTKIIADQRSNSLLVFATRPDMERIKEVISKLDVLLAQVLIETAIIDYSLGPNTFSLGISAAQNPKTFKGNDSNVLNNIIGGGGMNNGQSFYNFLTGALGTNGSSSVFGNGLPGGLSYFGNIGPTWDLALQAAASDSHASIVQRPRIQTSQAKPAQFFVGDTVPYITGYGNYGYGNQSTYSQLSVGVELDVTPFINPDGLVVMDIQQEIDDLNGYTLIENVGNVPNTIKRTLSSEVAVRDGDTIMLGGFIKSNKSTSRAGVPLLMDIPLLGNLFTSRNDSKQREELIVLMRPTVLRTPELAAAQAIKEQRRLPGVSAVEAEDEAAERKQVEAERKAELKRTKTQDHGSGFFTPSPPGAATDTNSAALPTLR
jgi:general secretion pathway protein D